MEYNQALSIGIPASYEALEERDMREECYRHAFLNDIQEAREEMEFFAQWFKA